MGKRKASQKMGVMVSGFTESAAQKRKVKVKQRRKPRNQRGRRKGRT